MPELEVMFYDIHYELKNTYSQSGERVLESRCEGGPNRITTRMPMIHNSSSERNSPISNISIVLAFTFSAIAQLMALVRALE